MPTPIRVGFTGLDHWYSAIPLAEAMAAHPGVEIVAISDVNKTRTSEVAARVGVEQVGTTVEDTLSAGVDLVVNYTSTERSAPVSIAAANAGAHIVSVKPLARTLDQATEIVRAVRAAGVRFIGSESRGRSSEHQQMLRQWVRDGRFGRLLTASYTLWSALPREWPDADGPGWFADPERAPGGGWIDHSIYQIDQLRWLTDANVSSVSATAANLKYPDLPVEDYGAAMVSFDNGLVAFIEDTWTTPAGHGRTSMSLVGSDAAVSFDSITGRLSLSGALHEFDGWAQVTPRPSTDSVDELVEIVQGMREPVFSVETAWENLAACEAFYESARIGSAVAPQPLPSR